MVSTVVPILIAASCIIGVGLYYMKAEFDEGKQKTDNILRAIRERNDNNAIALWSALHFQAEAAVILKG